MKIWGILSVAAADFLYIFYLKKKKTEILSHTANYLNFLQFLNVNVLDKKMTLYNGVLNLKGKISPYIDGFIDTFEKSTDITRVREGLIKTAEEYFSDISPVFKGIVREYFLILGSTDKKTSLDFYRAVYNECADFIANEKEKAKKSIKTISILTYGVSGMAILVLI